MGQLFKNANGYSSSWSSGCATFIPEYEFEYESGISNTFPVAVKCRIGNLKQDHIAILDTAAKYSVLSKDLADSLEQSLDFTGETIPMDTRLGKYLGQLALIDICFLADKDRNSGVDVTIRGSVLVVDGWPGPVFLGYKLCLERIRFALESANTADDQDIIYFGHLD